MSPLMKSLCQSHEIGPMAPPPLGLVYHEHMGNESNTPATGFPTNTQTPGVHTPPRPEPDPPTIYEPRVSTRSDAVQNDQPCRQLGKTLESPVPAQGEAINYEMALDGVSLGVLMLGAAIAAAPGVQAASAVCTTVVSGAERLSKTVQRATHLSRSLRGVGCKDENLSNGWVDISPQDATGIE
ncbi:hypothetical protein V565_087480 [Rhizoctonia solani 123E]|uniref:Uncharacterized protein n=1 Tax=Rhizoctonia solani 123E TaxID=1423351 RepID=A0A074RZF8_9AGAM|nr:hypothetical protein V565_087480 [Rhizoctonia solani 123E]